MSDMTRRGLRSVQGATLTVVLVLVWWFPAHVRAQAPPASVPAEIISYPQMILYNGSVLTADRDDANFTVTQAVAVRDGKFLATGTDAQIRRLAGPVTTQINLNGGSVVPGFMDTHQHLHEYSMRWLGKAERRPTLKFENLEKGLEELKAMVAATPPGEWVATSTRPYSARALNRTNLDAIAPKNPLLVEISSEENIINSLALEVLLKLAGPNVQGLLKDPKTGEPTGQLRDVAVGIMQYEALPWPYPAIPKFQEILKKEMALERSWGITTITTRITSDALTALNEMRRDEGTLPMRWRVGLPFPHLNPNAESFFHRLGDMDGMGDDFLRINGISFFSMDSAIGRGGAWTSKPKRALLPGDLSGDSGVDRMVNLPLVPLANKYGWNVTSIHSAGDQANTVLLDAYRKTSADRSIVGRRWGIDHGPMLTPEHAKLMAEYGITPSIQVKYVFAAPEPLITQYGSEALHKMTLIKTMIDAGIKVAGGADGAEDPFGHPLWNMEKMVTRTDEKGRVWGAKEAIDRKTALLTYTRWASNYSHDEKILGSIEPGKLADFVVLGDNYLTVPEAMISELPVRMTVIGGHVLYDRQRDGVLVPPKGGRSTDSERE